MLTIRLSRHGRIKRPFYRVVLTEHTKPAKSGYKTVLGSYDPLKYLFEADIPAIRTLIGQGAQPSERVAKLLFKATNDVFYKGFYKEIERT
ncbi:MAG: 30S ribosomal protein S16 [Candidatus Peribacteria bacterium]|jgi:small subunit ribosomal protein S16|nr:30S ribosomal protein S16 [Candidatus Peribacteria bacterium]